MRWPWVKRKHREQELNEEIQAHLNMAARDRIERGETTRSAEQASRREFGNRTRIQELTREVWRWSFLDRLWQDVQYGLRTMRRAPGFTAVAVLSLALGIGANTAIFSLVNTLMLRMLPVRDPGQLVELRPPGADLDTYLHLRDNNQVLSGLIAYATHSSSLSVGGEQEATNVDAQYVDGTYFQVLGVQPAIGRLIEPNDDSTEADPVAVLNWSFWNSRFNRDPSVVGRLITVGEATIEIIGVTPPGFDGVQPPSHPEIWLAMSTDSLIDGVTQRPWGVEMMGRLKPGGSIEQAETELATLYFQSLDQAKLKTDYYLSRVKFELEPARASPIFLRDRFSRPLLFVMAIVGLLLLIACTNVASMLLARGAARQREMALRVALGAGKIRLLRQALTESALLSTAGALVGVLFAYAGAATLVRIIQSGRSFTRMPEAFEIPIELDARVLLFTAAAAFLTGMLFGLVPALRAMSAAPVSSLRAAGKGVETRAGRFLGSSLVVSQVALSLLLLSAAGLFLHHLSNLRNGVGFQRENLLLVTLDPAGSGYGPGELARAYPQLLERFESIPGVRSTSVGGMTPILGTGEARYVDVEGYQDEPGQRRASSLNWVAPRYFETLGIPLLAGRDFTFEDRGAARLAIVNQTMARFYFGNANPIGRRFSFEGVATPYQIVGVVGDSKYLHPQETTPNSIYFPTFQEGAMIGRHLLLRTAIEPEAVTAAVRRAVSDVLETVPIQRVTTMAAQVDAAIVPERLVALLSGVFGVLGALLAAIGLYALLAYTVARRTGEIGIRMALGATPRDATKMVLRDALKMVALGLAAGVPAAFWSKRLAASVLEDLPIENPVPMILGAAAMVVVALLAAYVPARRAARVDPMEALRHE